LLEPDERQPVVYFNLLLKKILAKKIDADFSWNGVSASIKTLNALGNFLDSEGSILKTKIIIFFGYPCFFS